MGARNPADRPGRIDQMNMLDRNIGKVEAKVDAEAPDGTSSGSAARGVHRFILALRRAWQFSLSQSFSSLTRRIIFLNVTCLLALVIRILYFSPFRARL